MRSCPLLRGAQQAGAFAEVVHGIHDGRETEVVAELIDLYEIAGR